MFRYMMSAAAQALLQQQQQALRAALLLQHQQQLLSACGNSNSEPDKSDVDIDVEEDDDETRQNDNSRFKMDMEDCSRGSEDTTERPINFSIDKILSPTFGSSTSTTSPVRTTPNHHRDRRSSTSSSCSSSFGGTSDLMMSSPTTNPVRSDACSPNNRLRIPSGERGTTKTKPSEGKAAPPPKKGGSETTPPESAVTPAIDDSNKWPAWVYCTRYSDRPSSGPRSKRSKRKEKTDEKRPRTAFTAEQLVRLKQEFKANRYLTEKRRNDLARELGLNESQIKIWFQNKRAKIKKASGAPNPLALELMAQGLYNHSTIQSNQTVSDGNSSS